MTLIVDQQDIDNALAKFYVHKNDYYLTFANNVVYFQWTADSVEVKKYLESDRECLDIGLWAKDATKWTDACSIDPEDIPGQDFISCRYILKA